jgi:hypothetical protein
MSPNKNQTKSDRDERNQSNVENHLWLLKSRYADLGVTFRMTWDLYIKFYTVFLTFNIAGLGFFLSKESLLLSSATVGRKPYIVLLILVFVVQSGLVGVTSILMALYSKKAAADQQKIEKALVIEENYAQVPGFESIFPVFLARWAALANATVMLGMVAIWTSMYWR